MAYFDTGDKIRELRKERGLNQDQLAELASLNRVTIAKYESGRVEPGAQALSRIADALEVSTDVLLGRADEPEPEHHEEPMTPQIRIVSGWMANMPQEDQDRVVQMMQLMFMTHPEELLKREENTDD